MKENTRFDPTIVVDEVTEGDDGFNYKFTMSDPSDPNNKSYPVNISTATAIDFEDAEVRKELWKKYGYHVDQESTE